MAVVKRSVVDSSGDAQTKTGREISAKFVGILGAVTESEVKLNELKLLIKTQSESAAESEQERSRLHEQAMYQLQQERQAVVDRFAREDAEREAAYDSRMAAITEAETDLLLLLGISRDEEGHMQTGRAIEAAFRTKLADADKAGADRAFGIAKADYESKKRIDMAEANTASALLKQENEQLKRENIALAKQNTELLQTQQKTVDKIADVATGAFNAAGGVVKSGNDALSTAASGLGRNDRR